MCDSEHSSLVSRNVIGVSWAIPYAIGPAFTDEHILIGSSTMSPLLGGLIYALIAVLICAGLHYEGLQFASWVIKRVGHRRLRVFIGVVIVLLLHVLEVSLFAVGWWFMIHTVEQALSIEHPTFEEVLYFSFTTYTSLGYGDIVPMGVSRMLAGIEALVGLVLIAWSASFTFYEMQRYWDPRKESQISVTHRPKPRSRKNS